MNEHIDYSRVQHLEEENNSLRRAIMLIHRIANLVRGALELEPTFYALLTGVTAGVGLGLNRAMLFQIDEGDRNTLRGVAAIGPMSPEEADRAWRSISAEDPDLETLYEAGLKQRDQKSKLDRSVRALKVDAHGQSPIAIALRKGACIESYGEDDLGGLLDIRTSVAAPLRGRTSISGVLYADNRYTGRKLSSVSQMVFALLADQAGRAIEIAHQFEKVAHEARTDALTGLAHHGCLMEELNQTVANTLKIGGTLGVLMVDLDDFKQINDTYGHLVGDALLAGVAARMKEVLRSDERPFRYGGEEFTILLPGADRSAAGLVGERLRAAVDEKPFVVGSDHPLRVTCSVGAASMPEDGLNGEALISRADGALLSAKALGKNRVELS